MVKVAALDCNQCPILNLEFVLDSIVRWTKEERIGMQFTFVPPRLTSRLPVWLFRGLEESISQSVKDTFTEKPE